MHFAFLRSVGLAAVVAVLLGLSVPARAQSVPARSQQLFTFTGASQYPCSYEGTIRSVPGGSEVLFSFINNTSEPLQIIWLDFSGNRHIYDTLQAGGTYSVNTYIDHAWMIADISSNCLGIFGITGIGQISVFS